MFSFYSFLAFSAATYVLAAPSFPTEANTTELVQRTGTAGSIDTNNGFYHSFWTDGGADVTYTNEAAGEYNVTWSGDGNFVAGKGLESGKCVVRTAPLPTPFAISISLGKLC